MKKLILVLAVSIVANIAHAATPAVPALSQTKQALVRVVLGQILKNKLIQAGVLDGSGNPATPEEIDGSNKLIQNVLGLNPDGPGTSNQIQQFDCTAVLGEQQLCSVRLFHTDGPSSTEATLQFNVHMHFDGTIGTVENLAFAD
jgi:hypothetical protein